MREVLFSYIQFILAQVGDHALWFFLALFGVPVIWLVLKATNLLYEEKALSMGATIFGGCSAIAALMFIFSPTAELFWRPLLILIVGIMTYLCVAPIFCGSQKMTISASRKTFTIDSVTYPLDHINQVNVFRCFNRTKRSCSMEIFVSAENTRPVTLYYSTNNVAEFRKNVESLKKFAYVEYDSSLVKLSLDNPHFSLIAKVSLISLLIFCIILPSSFALNDVRAKKILPGYEMVVVPKKLYSKDVHNAAESDAIRSIFQKSNVQVVVFDGPYSSHYTGTYRKSLYSYPNQNYDYNIVFVRKNGLSFKHSMEPKTLMQVSDSNVYSKFLIEKCNRLCFLDNELGVMYSTDIETVDSRVGNIQLSVNMLDYVFGKRLEQKRIKEDRLRDQEEADSEEEDS